jgi:hypothetical protein
VEKVKQWIAEQNVPVFILHHDYAGAPIPSGRRMQTGLTNSTGLTEEQISDYQVVNIIIFRNL